MITCTFIVSEPRSEIYNHSESSFRSSHRVYSGFLSGIDATYREWLYHVQPTLSCVAHGFIQPIIQIRSVTVTVLGVCSDWCSKWDSTFYHWSYLFRLSVLPVNASARTLNPDGAAAILQARVMGSCFTVEMEPSLNAESHYALIQTQGCNLLRNMFRWVVSDSPSGFIHWKIHYNFWYSWLSSS